MTYVQAIIFLWLFGAHLLLLLFHCLTTGSWLSRIYARLDRLSRQERPS